MRYRRISVPMMLPRVCIIVSMGFRCVVGGVGLFVGGGCRVGRCNLVGGCRV